MRASKQFDRDKKIQSLARRIMDATIDAATVEYTKTLINIDTVDIAKLEAKLAAIAKQAAWPTTTHKRTIEQVSTARGNFKW